ncbi:hypothetical protein CC1G_05529 [Coprinopsis cinerea okayama7|uniref:Uncharacterized protein n=1 Tax=Coprinopsis cinerea (strain Okayama-7 / 130 / ATCC MYA-4618 / FGSC 9003) TaxID=240176 RepID=A8P5M2_COPC7|nr:hypothetical protein CC1G_05529 [Coprinopsis cinerea okayama7\|eukprot:XP_001838976.2 hypothetical protein CC1G_05529 [Coprinopsis cinerea okayama7\
MANTPPDNIPINRGDSVKAYATQSSSPDGSESPSWQTQSTLTSATSTSNSSSSPPGPMTPPPRLERSRSSRYGDLGRVPLHRRGTSKRYENFEDLLREAGYKETRVFTPEMERLKEAAADGRADENRLSSMGAVVDFLTNLFPGPGRHSRQPSDEFSPPPSPLGERRSVREPATPGDLSSSMESFDDATPKATSRQVSDARSRYDLSSRPSQASLYHPPPSPTLAHPRPSRAKAYLRHMASNISMQQPPRPNSTPAHHRAPFSLRSREKDDDDPSIIFTTKGNGEGEEDPRAQPPLPNTWLETVARAVLASGSGMHIGGPLQSHPASRRPQLRNTRSSLSQTTSNWRTHGKRRSGLSDQTNTLAPPPFLTMLERGRAGRSETEVTRTRVVCRSAPGSRASSLVRRESGMGRRERGRGDKRRRDADKDRLPSLARTQVEGDPWNHGRGRPAATTTMTANDVKNRYLRGRGRGAGSTMVIDDDYDDSDEGGTSDDDEDGDGEVDLRQMLVLPIARRQNSIHSLRRHLQLENASNRPQMARGRSFASQKYVRSPLSDDDLGQEWGSGWVRHGGGSAGVEDDEDTNTFAQVFGDARNRT